MELSNPPPIPRMAAMATAKRTTWRHWLHQRDEPSPPPLKSQVPAPTPTVETRRSFPAAPWAAREAKRGPEEARAILVGCSEHEGSFYALQVRRHGARAPEG